MNRILIILIVLAQPFFCLAQTEVKLNFQKDELKIEQRDHYAHIMLSGFYLHDLPGHPQLPVKQYLIPEGMELTDIRILETEQIHLDYPIWPAQKPLPLSVRQQQEKILKEEAVYNSADLYPATIVQQGAGRLLKIYPLQYRPAENIMLFHSKIRLILKGKPQIVQSNINPKIYLPGSIKIQDTDLKSSPEGNQEYIIITSAELAPSMDSLLLWKKQKGLNPALYTTEEIYPATEGEDEAAKIRNFIKQKYEQGGLKYVLLVGDSLQMPIRHVWAMDCEYQWGPEDQNNIPCDMYFADLDGSWDANGNGIYGEVSDDVSLDYEVFVGRLPADDALQAGAMARKIIAFEKNPPQSGFLDKMLFLAEILWDDPYTNSGLGLNLIDSLYIPEYYDPITKLYEADENENEETVTQALSEGYHFINHNGHAWYTSMGAGDFSISQEYVDQLDNGPRNSTVFSIGCWPAAFDYECIAENWLANPNGGAVAFFGNSRYGWGSPGNPEYGYSDLLNQAFYRQIFDEGFNHAGEILAHAKSEFIPYAQQENVYRWCMYEVNLMGDPEMPVYANPVREFALDGLPDSIPSGGGSLRFRITNPHTDFISARLCLMQQNGIYYTANSDASGLFQLDIPNMENPEPVLITITAKDFIPFQKELPVKADEAKPWISKYFTQFYTHDLHCYEDGRINLWLKSSSNDSIPNVRLSITSENDRWAVQDSVLELAGFKDSAFLKDAFTLKQIEPVENNKILAFRMHLRWGDEHYYSFPVNFRLVQPDIRLAGYFTADGAEILESGSAHSFGLVLTNAGSADAQAMDVELDCPSARLEFRPSLFEAVDISAHSADTLYFVAEASEGQSPDFPEVDVNYTHPCKTTEPLKFKMAIGKSGFFDNMENGQNGWYPHGWLDHWHISTNRAHSGTHSWYCGYPDSLHYEKGMWAKLDSPPFLAGLNPELEFYAWYLLPNYGTNGLIVETSKDNKNWIKHDYFGSGGALPVLSTGNDWMPYKYDLSPFYQPTDSIRLRLTFVSTWQRPTEGVYIDDVRIGSRAIKIETSINEKEIKSALEVRVSPNPIDENSRLRFYSEIPAKYRLSVFDFTGRFLAKIVEQDFRIGENYISLDGLQALGTGIYLLKLESDESVGSVKILVL